MKTNRQVGNRSNVAMVLAAMALLAVAPFAFAQRLGPPPGGPGGPPWGGLPGPGGRFGGRVVANAPYSAVGVSTFTQKLSDGNSITSTNSTNVFRDSTGRTRQEETLSGIGLPTSSATPQQVVFISDPVAGYSYVLNPQNKTYHQMKLRAPPASAPAAPPERNPPGNAQVQRTDLGTQTINGVTAQGTQTTLTIPAGQIGNQQPIVVTSVRWVATDLQVVVQSSRNDPRMGNTVYNLNNVQRGEPSPALFQIPSDYTLQQGPGGPPAGRGLRQQRPSERIN